MKVPAHLQPLAAWIDNPTAPKPDHELVKEFRTYLGCINHCLNLPWHKTTDVVDHDIATMEPRPRMGLIAVDQYYFITK